MTRFARAKGSKASNERLPNEPTPWHVMKQQLESNVSSKNNQPEKAKSAKQLLKEKDNPFYYDTTGNVNNDWAEFERPKTATTSAKQTAKETKTKGKKDKKKPENSKLQPKTEAAADLTGGDAAIMQKKNSKKQKSETSLKKSEETALDTDKTGLNSAEPEDPVASDLKSKKRRSNISSVETVRIALNSVKVEEDKSADADLSIVAAKKSKKRKSDGSTVEAASPEAQRPEMTEKPEEAGTEPKKKKKKNRSKEKKRESAAAESAKVVEATVEETEKPIAKLGTNETSGKMSKRQKRNQKRQSKIAGEKLAADVEAKPEAPVSGGFDAAGNDWSSNVNFGKQQKFEKTTNGNQRGPGGNEPKRPPSGFDASRTNGAIKRKAPKIRDDKEHKRRKPDSGAIKCTINGMDVEIVKYDGFPVKREDAERLKDLRQQMVLKGIPRSEIDAAMKLERRKAEKSLARVRKQVCFHCRKAGHNLSECPELGEGETATGICFKCGSTEHTHFECKVTRKQEYGFASCFICREQGHIAKQCPDNPKGLYPQGGACKICGDVTHLRKDCPEATREKEDSAMTLSTIADAAPESLDEEATTRVATAGDDSKRTQGKVVKF